MPNESAGAEVLQVSIRNLKLRPGMSLQVQRTQQGAAKQEAQFLAAIDGKGVMVGPHGGTASAVAGMKAGEEYLVSGFTGQYDFSFASKVIQTFEEPFTYALFTYPPEVTARMVRRAMRMKTSLPGSAGRPGAQAVGVTLIDVSVAGTMVKSPVALGAVNDVLNLNLVVDFEGSKVNLNLQSTVCHSNKADTGDGFNVGLLFKNLAQNDKLVLHYLTQSAP